MNDKKNYYCINRALISKEGHTNGALDPFINMIKKIIYENQVNTGNNFNIKFVERQMRIKFNVIIPPLVLKTLLNEIIKEGIIELIPYEKSKKIEEYDYYYRVTNFNKLEKYNLVYEERLKELTENYQKLMNLFYKFNEKEQSDIQDDDLENILNIFIREQSFYIAMNDKLTKRKYSKGLNTDKENYFVAKFIDSLRRENKKYIELIQEINFGYVIEESLKLNFIQNNKDLDRLSVFLDTPFIFNLLGIHPINERENYIDIIDELMNRGAKIYTFDNIIKEVKRSLMDAEVWVENDKFDLSKSSLTTEYYRLNGFSKDEVRKDLELLESNLSKFNIKIKSSNITSSRYSEENNQDIKLIEQYINDTYDLKDKSHKLSNIIYNDALSINGIYLNRGDNMPLNLYDKNSILLTDNYSICIAAKRYNYEVLSKKTFPPVMLDIHISTLLWLNNSQKLEKVTKEKFNAQIYTAFNPSKSLLTKYIEEVNKVERSGEYDLDIIKVLKTSKQAKELLMDITMGDRNNVNKELPGEIFNRMKNEIVDETTKVLNEKHRLEVGNYKEIISTTLLEKKDSLQKIEKNISMLKKHENKITLLIKILILILYGLTINLLGGIEFITNKFNFFTNFIWLVPILLERFINIIGTKIEQISHFICIYLVKRYKAYKKYDILKKEIIDIENKI